MARRKSGRPVSGWLNFDKPADMTSTHAVNLVKRLFNARKAGHAGTLDPLATGVLPIAFGEATKTVNFAVDGEKSYQFVVEWGSETTTDDCEGDVTVRSESLPTREEVARIASSFVGEILQVPPRFSAIKIDGQRAYDLARDGAEVALEARPIVVYDLRVVDMPTAQTTTFEAQCGRGTYVRAIARDIGRALGCYGHITALRRTRVGCFDEATAVTIDEIDAARAGVPAVDADRDQGSADDETAAAGLSRKAALAAACDRFILPVEAALDGLDEVVVAPSDAGRIRRGQSILLRGAGAPPAQKTAFATVGGRLVAIGEIEQGSFVPTRVFNL